ncbi:MAG: hypothetical protein OXC82_07390 [Rhodobacteraceae bacterium]|nr:hypothetical protein [Paracoccaceae bacterium]MCY4250240.1 hypothetical protein [Paracoccaceae bacterium]MCY4307809.1 hypothetical protein [Paracoccaceae bacterium]
MSQERSCKLRLRNAKCIKSVLFVGNICPMHLYFLSTHYHCAYEMRNFMNKDREDSQNNRDGKLARKFL